MSRFHADCSRCCGLCCIVPAQLRIQGFPFNKSAEHSCRHLAADARCAIHANRDEHGFSACAGFDCHGAGQWVTALCGGAKWGRSEKVNAALTAAWHYWLPRFATAALLDAALAWVSAPQQQIIQRQIDTLLGAPEAAAVPGISAARQHREALALIRSMLGRQ